MRACGACSDLWRLWPNGPVCPHMNFLHLADGPGADNFNSLTQAIFCGTLVAHLGADLLFPGKFPENTGFLDRMGKWLLHIYMFAHAHGHGGGGGMCVIRSADHHAINILAHFLEHLAEIVVLFRLGELLTLLAKGIVIHIADGNHIAELSCLINVTATLATHTHAGEAQAFQCRGFCGCCGNATSKPETCAGNGRVLNKTTTIHLLRHEKLRCQGGRNQGFIQALSLKLREALCNRFHPFCKRVTIRWQNMHLVVIGLLSRLHRRRMMFIIDPGKVRQCQADGPCNHVCW